MADHERSTPHGYGVRRCRGHWHVTIGTFDIGVSHSTEGEAWAEAEAYERERAKEAEAEARVAACPHPASAPTTPTCEKCRTTRTDRVCFTPDCRNYGLRVDAPPVAPEGGETSETPLTHCRECGSSAWMIGLQAPNGTLFYCSVCKGHCDPDQQDTIAILFDGMAAPAPDRLREAARAVVRMLDARELTLRDGISPLAQREAVVALSEFRIAVAERAS